MSVACNVKAGKCRRCQEMKSKNWYESKGIWAGLAIVAVAILQLVTGADTVSSAITFFEGLGIVGIRQAVN